MTAPPDIYRVYAVKYGHHERPAADNFIDGDSHELPMPLDYFVWVLQSEKRTFVVDTGFDRASAGRRSREFVRPVDDGLRAIGIDPAQVEDVLITHMHFDHAGNGELFPRARYHVQDREMAYCTGRCMCHRALSRTFDADDVARMVHRVFDGRVVFHDGDAEVASGVGVHLVGGHTDGLQAVRVHTAQGWMVLASDASHLYANMEGRRPFPAVYNVGDMLEGYTRLYALADRPELVIPGHDPEVLRRFKPHAPDTEGWIVRLDAPAF